MAHVKEINALGIGMRFFIALVLVFATYNPDGYSYFHWVTSADTGAWPIKAFVGVVLLIGWTIFLRATLRSLGGFGIVLAIAFFATLLWVLTNWGVIPSDSIKAVTYLSLFVIAALLATGLVWSHIRRRVSGQVDVDEIEGD